MAAARRSWTTGGASGVPVGGLAGLAGVVAAIALSMGRSGAPAPRDSLA
jgi:hypothetical protein